MGVGAVCGRCDVPRLGALRWVSVAGEFNGWSDQAAQLGSEGNGYWSTDVPGARAGQQYKYVVRASDSGRWRNDPYAREVTHSAGNSIVYADGFDWGPSAFGMPPWDELVVYELHVGTFNDEPGSGPGGFRSVEARLDYLRDLGINAVELLPSAEFATDFSWGYNPSHIFAIEKAYGGPDALKGLVRAAHERGIAVIVDVTFNHLGPSDLDLWQFDGWSENDNGGIYFYNDRRRQTPWGDTRPD
jgi:1,4-alpha-glucan branching enzyme